MPDSADIALREAMREAINGLRTDFRELASELRESLRMICDPVTGYIPRSEYSERHDGMRRELDGKFREQAIGIRWAVGICISIGVLVLSTAGAMLGFGLHVVQH